MGEDIENRLIQRHYQDALYLDVYLRKCRVGEIRNGEKCFVCTDKTVSLSQGDEKCQDCPEHAKCEQGNVIDVEPGYWRAKEDKIDIFECANEDLCMGGNVFDE